MLSVISTCKMGTIFGAMFFALLMSGKVETVLGAVYSTPDTALRFAHCLIGKMSESQFFTMDDRNSIIEVADVMAQAMSNRYQPRIPVKILVIAFITSMADVIVHEDISKNTHRKGVYASALEQCSLSTAGYVDVEFIMEALRIVSSIEQSKLSKFIGNGESSELKVYDSNKNPQPSDILNPLGVQPSPVQNPPVAESFKPNDKTHFEIPIRAFNSHSIASNSGFNSQFQMQSASNTGISAGFNNRGVLQSGSGIPILPSQVALGFGGLNVPQTKESSVVVIPPTENKQVVQSEPFPRLSPLETSKIIFQPSITGNIPQQGTFVKTSFASLPQSDGGSNIPPNPSFERALVNILMESENFKNTFNFNIPQENAISLARLITEQSLKGYNLDIISSALTAISNQVAEVSFQSPENYAVALSNALVSVLKLHNLPLFVEGSRIAESFLANLNNARQLSLPAGNVWEQPKDYEMDEYIKPANNEKQVDFNFESPPIGPEDTDGEVFSEVLSKCLSDSSELENFFCNSKIPEERVKISFNLVKSALADYGQQVSSVAASIISSVLSERSTDDLCSNYVQILSKVISEVLEENSAIEEANAQDISNKMIFYLNQQAIIPLSSESTSKDDMLPMQDSSVISNGVTPTLQSSFQSGYDTVTASSTINQPSSDSMTSAFGNANYGTSDYLDENYNADVATSAAVAPASPIQMSSVGYSSTINIESTTPLTTPSIAEITDAEVTIAVTFTEAFPTLSDFSSTESSSEWTSDDGKDVIDQGALAIHLLESFETELEAYLETSSEPEDLNPSTVSSITTEKIKEDTDSDSSLDDEDVSSQTEISDQSKNSRRNRRRYRERKATSTQSDTWTISPIPTKESVQAENATQQQQETKQKRSGELVGESTGYVSEEFPFNQQTEFKVISGGQDESSYALSKDSSGKVSPVELQPSFQGPPLTDFSEAVTPKSSTDFYDIQDRNSLILMAKSVSQLAASTIAYIHSDQFEMMDLCARLNKLAPIVDIPPLDYCSEIPAIDYLLNILKSTIKKLEGV